MTELEWKRLAKQFAHELKNYKLKYPESFSWKKHKSFGNKTTAIIGKTNHNLSKMWGVQMRKGWTIANSKNNALASQYLRNFHIGTKEFPSYFNTNVGAMSNFINRSINGMNLSQNIWKHSAEAMDILENYVGTGIAVGRSSEKIARDVMKVLKEPNRMLTKPGRGRYKSPFANSMRMARTETNMAYRQADHLRYKQMKFVTGIRVKLSGVHPKLDICDSMEGDYPKGFQFLGWHPNCFCYQTSILASEKDFIAHLKGQPIPIKNRITKMPIRAQRFLKDNLDKFKNYKTLPYWISNNRHYINKTMKGAVKTTNEIRATRLMGKAQKAGPGVFKTSTEYADRFGGVSTPLNFKSESSIIRKTVTELQGDMSRIKDAVRTTVIVPKSKVRSVYNAMAKDPRFAQLKIQTRDKYMGYQGVLTNVKTNQGILGEIQVNSPEMIFAKEPPKIAKSILGNKQWNEVRRATGQRGGLGHKYYEEYRLLNPKIPKQALRRIELEQLSIDYYRHFW